MTAAGSRASLQLATKACLALRKQFPVAVPTLGSSRAIYQDGVEVWNGTAAVSGATASDTGDGYIAFSGVTGSHTWAW